MDLRLEQLEYAPSPILTSDAGMWTDATRLHPLNAKSSIEPILSGRENSFSELQLLNAYSPILFKVDGKSTCSNDEQSANA